MSEVEVVIRNPLDHRDQLTLYFVPNDTQLAKDWTDALAIELRKKSELEKNYCWHGWPDSTRSLEYLCDQLNHHSTVINNFSLTGVWQSQGLNGWDLPTNYAPEYVRYPITGIDIDGERGGTVNHDVMNEVHNAFEHLQGTVENLSDYYKLADAETKYSIRQINNLCHEIETMVLSLRKKYYSPMWVRPSQITTFLNATRYLLTDKHRQGFVSNGYNRKFGHAYMHWTQIGKTLMEVYSDEHAPQLDQATCDAITHLQYYSGEFDVEWGKDVVYGGEQPWHTAHVDGFNAWLRREGFDPADPKLSLGYLEVGKVDLLRSFGTEDQFEIWDMMSPRLDIFSITCNNETCSWNQSWADVDYAEHQMSKLSRGYNHV